MAKDSTAPFMYLQRHGKATAQPPGILPWPGGQSEAVKDSTGPRAELDSDLELSELQRVF